MKEQKTYRYPGLKPFSVTERNIFFGRKEDIRKLSQQVLVENQVLVYARSGLGKSSLLNAGLIPQLLDSGHFQPVRIRFGACNRQNPYDLLEQVYDSIAGDATPVPEFLSKVGKSTHSLWYACKCAAETTSAKDTLVLICDQFEEVFTYPRPMVDRFKKELADLIHNVIPKEFRSTMEAEMGHDEHFLSDEEIGKIYEPLNVKVVYAIRSDKLSHMDQFKDVLPDILSRTYELSALSRSQAEDAILNPAYQKGDHFFSPRFDFKDDAMDGILDFLTKGGESEVESFQLQVICQFAENQVIQQGKKSITLADLGEIGNIFENYYEGLIAQLPTPNMRDQARELIEEGLILEGEEIRLSLHEGQIQRDFSLSEELLQRLVDTRLVRREPSSRGGFVYELSHDTLIKPILKSRRRRLLAAQEVLQELEARKARRRLIGAVATLALVTIGAFAALFFAMWAWNQKLVADTLKDKAVEDKVLIQEQKRQLDSLLLAIDNQLKKQSEKGEMPRNDADSLRRVIRMSIDKVVDERQVKRLELTTHLFNSNENVRQGAVDALLRNWLSDPGLSVCIARYGLEHPNTADEAIWSSLYVLEQMDAAAMQGDKDVLIDYLDWVALKPYGATTQKRIANIRSKVK